MRRNIGGRAGGIFGRILAKTEIWGVYFLENLFSRGGLIIGLLR